MPRTLHVVRLALTLQLFERLLPLQGPESPLGECLGTHGCHLAKSTYKGICFERKQTRKHVLAFGSICYVLEQIKMCFGTGNVQILNVDMLRNQGCANTRNWSDHGQHMATEGGVPALRVGPGVVPPNPKM